MRALVIEDDLKTAAYLQQGPSENGFVVDVCNNGEESLYQALTTNLDLIILDVMLPKRDGGLFTSTVLNPLVLPTRALRHGRFTNRNSGNA